REKLTVKSRSGPLTVVRRAKELPANLPLLRVSVPLPMTDPISAAGSAVPTATPQQKRSAAAWVEPVARIGFASIAVVYMTIVFLALLLAVGKGGQATDHRGAIDVLEN